jgi:hypothetical protein
MAKGFGVLPATLEKAKFSMLATWISLAIAGVAAIGSIISIVIALTRRG